MRIKVSRVAMKEAIVAVSGTIPGRRWGKAPKYQLRVVGNRLEVSTHVHRLCSYAWVDGTSDAPIDDKTVTVEASDLERAIMDEGDEFVLISLSPDCAELRSTGSASIKLSATEPADLQSWGLRIASTKKNATLAVNDLVRGIKTARLFVQDYREHPRLCSIEFSEGILYGAHKRGASSACVAGSERLTARIHIRDLPFVVSFLNRFKGKNVEVWEGSDAMFLRCDDAVLGCTRPSHAVPNPMHALDSNHNISFEVERRAVLRAIDRLQISGTPEVSISLVNDEKDASRMILCCNGETIQVEIGNTQGENLFSGPSDFIISDLKALVRYHGTEDQLTLTMSCPSGYSGKRGCWIGMIHGQAEPSSKATIVSVRKEDF